MLIYVLSFFSVFFSEKGGRGGGGWAVPIDEDIIDIFVILLVRTVHSNV